jgi:hypothetical protein
MTTLSDDVASLVRIDDGWETPLSPGLIAVLIFPFSAAAEAEAKRYGGSRRGV